MELKRKYNGRLHWFISLSSLFIYYRAELLQSSSSASSSSSSRKYFSSPTQPTIISSSKSNFRTHTSVGSSFAFVFGSLWGAYPIISNSKSYLRSSPFPGVSEFPNNWDKYKITFYFSIFTLRFSWVICSSFYFIYRVLRDNILFYYNFLTYSDLSWTLRTIYYSNWSSIPKYLLSNSWIICFNCCLDFILLSF